MQAKQNQNSRLAYTIVCVIPEIEVSKRVESSMIVVKCKSNVKVFDCAAQLHANSAAMSLPNVYNKPTASFELSTYLLYHVLGGDRFQNVLLACLLNEAADNELIENEVRLLKVEDNVQFANAAKVLVQ